MRCKTPEQLAFILEKAAPAPLNLYVYWPPEDGTLELIPSTVPINFLSLWDTESDDIDLGPFEHLNFSKLSALELGAWIPDYTNQILDLALPSSCEEFSITYYMMAGPPDESFFYS
jgi:hypothetical protein